MNEQALFTATLERDPVERSAFLNAACGSDAELRKRVEQLLRLHENAGDFLEQPAVAWAATRDASAGVEEVGHTIGRYKLLEEIGEGGMGMVYLAEQQEPIRRRIALKIIKAGMDTRRVIARFEAERQALALMDHPNITRMFDAGATDSGRPYFVMELVEGLSLTAYCDQHQLSIPERLALFVQVCQAVQHAHQKGIIHRDLKPSHVIVTLCEGVPVPKIIDFGIAKAIGGSFIEQACLTIDGQMIGTPLYMSPEQAEMSGLEVDTRSDIYSLGVVLYELLSGCTPFGHEQVRKAGYDEIRRLIREEEPARPNTQVSTAGEAAATISANRQTNPIKLRHLLRGDLDCIVMKALHKDRARRYQTASDFARDIERYLNHEPIEARPPTWVDRAAKWTRRHAGLVVACAVTLLVALIISAASAVLIHQAWAEAIRERIVAEENYHEAETQRHRAVTNFRESLGVLQSVLLPDNIPQAMAFLHRFIDDSSADPGVRLQTGMAYVHLAGLYNRQGQGAQAIAAWERSIAVFEGLVAQFPEDHIYWIELGQSQNILGQYLYANNEHALAREQFGRALDDYRQALQLDEDAKIFNLLAWFRATCPDVEFRDPQLAVAAAERAVQLAPDSRSAWNTLGVAHCRAENWAKSLVALEKSMALNNGGDSFDWFFVSMVHWHLGHKSEARGWYDKAVSSMEENPPKDGESFRLRAEAAQLLGVTIQQNVPHAELERKKPSLP